MTEDQTINCIDCGKDFIFSKGEYDFLKQNVWKDGNENFPKRCKDCGRAKRQNRNNNRNFNRN